MYCVHMMVVCIKVDQVLVSWLVLFLQVNLLQKMAVKCLILKLNSWALSSRTCPWIYSQKLAYFQKTQHFMVVVREENCG